MHNKNSLSLRRQLLALAVTLALQPALASAADDDFELKDIEVKGLQRIDPGTVFTYLPLRVGDEFDAADATEVIRTLYQTGFFTDVSVFLRDDVLVIEVKERPAIAEIVFEGNDAVESEDLETALRESGLSKGRVLDSSMLERVEKELERVYFSLGYYGVRIETELRELDRNRVAVNIDISEGVTARIRQLNIVGNRDFDEDDLLDEFQLGIPGPLNFFSTKDEYSRQKLAADLETLRAFYLDRGYLKFNIESTQVTTSADRRDIYVTINITEGDVYALSEVAVTGNLMLPEEELLALIDIETGKPFSRKQVTAATSAVNNRLGDLGYAFANVNAIPELDEENKTVKLTFYIDPGKRVYVRRITFSGNYTTDEEVYRRELRQMESAPYSGTDIERSKVRLQRLSYVESVNVETTPVAGTGDQVDLTYGLGERMSGSFSIGAGYSQSQGIILNLGLEQSNFLGTGKNVRFNFDNSDYRTNYTIGYTNPYYTMDGVSRGFTAYYRKTDADEADISRYLTNRAGAEVNYGIPISEYDSVRLGAGLDSIEILGSTNPSEEVLGYAGDRFNMLMLNASWSRDSRNRVIFADRGSLHRLSLDVASPGSDLEFWKLDYRTQHYFPFFGDWALGFGADVGYGEAYGKTPDGVVEGKLPFFENYYAGGIRTVRGFEDYSLGPKDSNGDPLGGSLKVTGRGEIILPVPFMENSNSVRLSAFYDIGNVFDGTEAFEADELRQSVGAGLIWLSPVGPLSFSFAKPLNDKEGDETQAFQFSLGTGF